MLKATMALWLIRLSHLGLAQEAENPEHKIDYWLAQHTLAPPSPKAETAQRVFAHLLKVADKPLGVLPRLYVFSDLDVQKTFALPDGNIILPFAMIDFCYQSPRQAEARLAFVLGHELKHILRGDYHFERILALSSDSDSKRVLDSTEPARRKRLETEADEFGILYVLLAGYEVNAVISPTTGFISDYYRAAGLDIHGDLTINSVADRLAAMNRRLGTITTHLDLFEFGLRLYAVGRYEAAITVLEKFVTQYPAREVFNNLGMCFYQKALWYYARWKHNENDPHLAYRVSAQIDPHVRVVDTGTRSVDEQAFRQAIAGALANFEAAKDRDAGYEVAWNNLGCAHLLKDDLHFAKGYFEEALRLAPSYREARNNLGVAYAIEGNTTEAAAQFNAALSLPSRYLEPLYNLAVLHRRSSNESQAAGYFSEYLRHDNVSAYAEILRREFGAKPKAVALPEVEEKIHGQTATSAITNFAGLENQFVTPEASISVCRDNARGLIKFQYTGRRSSEKIVIWQAGERYVGRTARGVAIGAPVKVLEVNYPFPYVEKDTTLGAYRIYDELGLVFEIKGQKIRRWFLYEIL